MLLVSSIVYGQTPIDNDTQNEDETASNESFTSSLIETAIENGYGENKELIEEFKQIMAIPKEHRSVSQWDRALEIIFLIYGNSDIKSLIKSLQDEVDLYNKLTAGLSDMLSKLETLYEKEYQAYEDLSVLQSNLSKLYSNYERMDKPKRLMFFVEAGYAVNVGLSAGIGILSTSNESILFGANLDWKTNFKDRSFFSANLIFGWSF